MKTNITQFHTEYARHAASPMKGSAIRTRGLVTGYGSKDCAGCDFTNSLRS